MNSATTRTENALAHTLTICLGYSADEALTAARKALVGISAKQARKLMSQLRDAKAAR